MHSPVLVSSAARLPFTTAELKAHLRVDHNDEDALIDAYQAAAVGHVERAYGVVLEAQTWRVDFDAIDDIFRLPKAPVIEIESITVRNSEGQLSTISEDDYSLFVDPLGPFIRMKDDYSAPADLYQIGAVRVTWVVGHAVTPAVPAQPPAEATPEISNSPAPVKAAVLLMVGDLYANREGKVGNDLIENDTVKALLSTYRVFW